MCFPLTFRFQWAKGQFAILQDLQCKRQPNIHCERIQVLELSIQWIVKIYRAYPINDFAHFERDSIKRKRRQTQINKKLLSTKKRTLTSPYTMHRIISSLALILVAFVHTSKSDIMVYSQMSSQVNHAQNRNKRSVDLSRLDSMYLTLMPIRLFP